MREILIIKSNNLKSIYKEYLEKLGALFFGNQYSARYVDELSEALNLIQENAKICCVLFDWQDYSLHDIAEIEYLNQDLPIFAISSSRSELDINLQDFKLNLGFLQYDSNLLKEDYCRILHAIDQYFEEIIPPFTKSLMKFNNQNKYNFCTPGHLGGAAFYRSPIGSVFRDFYGDNIFKSDISISMTELGSLLDHSGPHKEAEEMAAKVFNADKTYFVTNGTSTSNKIVGMYAATEGDTVLIDRNCHKSICHFMMMTNVIPIYLKATRNAYGIIGGIPKSEFTKESIKQKIEESHLNATFPKYAVITNSTYDGLLYNVDYIKETLDTKTLHFDSAWTPYAQFDNIYKNKYGMNNNLTHSKIIFETHSTHKLLASFSQGSMIHIKGNYDEELMNECFMMHTSTSPFYPIIASCEIAAAMMQGNRGHNIMKTTLNIAYDFRKEIKRLNQESNSWYFDIWQPQDIDNLECWELKSNDSWHGFMSQDNNHLYLDPIKVTITLPGIEGNDIAEFGIPANILAMYLDDQGIIVEKVGPYSILILISLGVTRAKTMKLLSALNNFKNQFDNNKSIQSMIPNLYEKHPDFYKNMRIQDLATKIHNLNKKFNLPKLLFQAFENLPIIELTPHLAYQKLLRGKYHTIKLQNAINHTSAVMILPYPPGIPLLMPGEKITSHNTSILEYLLLLHQIGNLFPGFETDIHGVTKDKDGDLTIKVLN